MERVATPPAGVPAKPTYTAEQLLEISQDDTHRFELIRGDLIVMSPTGHEHGELALLLGSAILTHVSQHGLGKAYAAETGFRLTQNPDTVLALDVGFVHKDNLTPDRIVGTFMLGAPDLVIEVLSPSDTAVRITVKVQTWLRHGAQLVWVVEPESATVTVYRADGTVALLKSGDTLDGEQTLPGFTYPLAQLFR